MKVNAIGLPCPQPVIQTKKALESMESGVLEVVVDNMVARENVKKLAAKLGFPCQEREEGDKIIVMITKGQEAVKQEVSGTQLAPRTLAIAAETMGRGDEELGKILMKGFIYSLTEVHPYPKTILFYNGGVKLACEGAESIEDLEKLEAAGVEILVCGTCLNFFDLGDKIAVGSVSNMYTIVEALQDTENTLILS
jgi:selenium metabolism protein YedF